MHLSHRRLLLKTKPIEFCLPWNRFNREQAKNRLIPRDQPAAKA